MSGVLLLKDLDFIVSQFFIKVALKNEMTSIFIKIILYRFLLLNYKKKVICVLTEIPF